LCALRFGSEADTLAFCRLLFDLKDLDHQELLLALGECIGVRTLEHGVALD
jgi:hypothetical protein